MPIVNRHVFCYNLVAGECLVAEGCCRVLLVLFLFYVFCPFGFEGGSALSHLPLPREAIYRLGLTRDG